MSASKSAIGLMPLSRVPRRLRQPGWCTTPPIAKRTPDPEPPPPITKEPTVDEKLLNETRRILRGLVLAVTDNTPGFIDRGFIVDGDKP